VETLEAQVEALRLRHAEIERDSDTQCSRLRAEVEALEEQVETLKQRQMDIEREADMAAELLLQAEAEGTAHLSATALVKEALANKSDGAISATARVRDALAHHMKAGGNR
jgi:predicted nuclease with TOPRIM domain